jgi:hypothetical protein
MNFDWLINILKYTFKLIDNFFSLKYQNILFKESKFNEYKQDYSQRLLDNFLDVALAGISAALLFRVFILENKNTFLDLILPLTIFLLIFILYMINKNTKFLKHYFHIMVIPMIGYLTARKTIS